MWVLVGFASGYVLGVNSNFKLEGLPLQNPNRPLRRRYATRQPNTDTHEKQCEGADHRLLAVCPWPVATRPCSPRLPVVRRHTIPTDAHSGTDEHSQVESLSEVSCKKTCNSSPVL